MSSVRSLRTPFLLLLVCSFGCGSSSMAPKAQSDQAPQQREVKVGAANALPVGQASAEPSERKIIHNATMEIIVEDFDAKRQELERLIEVNKAYVARSEFTGNIGAKRTGVWAIRVPIDATSAFVAAVKALGQPIKDLTDAQDVTEEYVDTQSLLNSLRESETKLNQLMKEKAQTLQDFAIWEEKISTVRREIARYDARMRTLTRLTAMATVNITLRDDRDYLPKTTPAYGSTIARTFWTSVDAAASFGEGLLLFLVALVVWLPLIIPGFFALRWIVRRVKREWTVRDSSTFPSEIP